MTEHKRSTQTRTVAGKAHVSILVSEEVEDLDGYAMVVPTDEDVDFRDLGDLVADRIEANGRVTLPDSDQRPDHGEQMYLGFVTWDSNGIPIRLERLDDSGISVEFNANGGVLQVTEHDTDHGGEQ